MVQQAAPTWRRGGLDPSEPENCEVEGGHQQEEGPVGQVDQEADGAPEGPLELHPQGATRGGQVLQVPPPQAEQICNILQFFVTFGIFFCIFCIYW